MWYQDSADKMEKPRGEMGGVEDLCTENTAAPGTRAGAHLLRRPEWVGVHLRPGPLERLWVSLTSGKSKKKPEKRKD